MQPQKFFISYAQAEVEERQLAAWLHDALRTNGHEVFMDTNIPLGTRWADEIERCINRCDFLIVLLSAAARASDMVTEEVRRARDCHLIHGRPIIIPLRVRYDGDLGYILSALLRPFQWARWESDNDSARVLQAILRVATHPSTQLPSPRSTTLITGSTLSATILSHPMPMASPVPGGSMLSNDPFYITRSNDERILERAQSHGETVTIEAPRQMGKSSLLQRYLTACQHAGQRVVLIDFGLFTERELATCAGLLSSIAMELQHALDPDDASEPVLNNPQRFTHWLERQILTRVSDTMVLAFDESDRVFDHDYRRDFFMMLRSWQNRRARSQDWRRLGLALVISTERNLLIDDATASPFNIGLHVVLRPFSLAEGQQLNQRYQQHSGFALVEDEVVQLWELLGGQPYLMRQAYHALSTGQVPSFAGLLDDASRDDSIFADHLRAVLKRLRLRPDYRLTTAFRQIIHGRKVSVQEAVPRLQSAGLVRYDGQRSVPASTLYARFFGRVL
jgi:hypothetical protein